MKNPSRDTNDKRDSMPVGLLPECLRDNNKREKEKKRKMKYKGNEIRIPTIEMIDECIKEFGYNLNAEKIWKRYEAKGWKTNKKKDIVSLEALINSMNGVFNRGCSKEKKLVSSPEKKNLTRKQLWKLANAYSDKVTKLYDNLIDDIKAQGYRGTGWIVKTLVDNIEGATYYELLVAYYLIRKDIEFVQQAPFYINGKISFADFYIPSKKVVIEVDGGYHDEIMQILRDDERAKRFKSMGIDTIRIWNKDAYSDEALDSLLV